MNVKGLLRNKYVLYTVLFLAITNVVGYLTVRDFRSVTMFVAIALLTSYFSKNMIVNLGSAIVLTNMFAAKNIMEGMKKGAGKSKKGSNDEKPRAGLKEGACDPGYTDKNGVCEQDGFTQRNVPKSTPASTSDDDDQIGKRIDYAATLENAYDNLQGILGAKGMDGLTKETQKLIKQQSSLMQTLNTMTPVLNNAKSTLDKFDLGSLTKSLGSLQGMVKGGK